jgi:hypothetical protein
MVNVKGMSGRVEEEMAMAFFFLILYPDIYLECEISGSRGSECEDDR